MKSAIVLSAFLAVAAAATLPVRKSDSQNELIQADRQQQRTGGDFETFRVHEERDAIANSFDDVVAVLRQYADYDRDDSTATEDELAVADTLNAGNESDTFLTSVRVRGLKDSTARIVAMSWGEDLVNAVYSWPSLSVTGTYHFVNCISKHTGPFRITLTEPKYSGDTSMTRNANIYPAMSPAGSVAFGKAVVDHARLPEVFQDQRPQFEYLIKNVVLQRVATAVAGNVYNDMTLSIRQAVRPYLRYRSDKIAADDSPFTGRFDNGDRYELTNIRFDNHKNNLGKIAFVRANRTAESYTATLQLRLLNLAGESDFAVTASDGGQDYNGKIAYNFDTVKVVAYLNFNDKSAHTSVFVDGPRVEFKLRQDSAVSRVQQQFEDQLIEYFTQRLGKSVNDTVKNAM